MAQFTFTFFETDPTSFLPTTVGATYTFSGDGSEFVDPVAATVEDNVDEVLSDNAAGGVLETGRGTFTLTSGMELDDIGIELEDVWTLQYTDGGGQLVTFQIGNFEYDGDANGSVTDKSLILTGDIPPPGTMVTVIAFDQTPRPDEPGALKYTELFCLASGTLVLTDRGDVAVEHLRCGDLVLTRDNGLQPLRWIGRRTVEATGRFAPVVIGKGAVGNARQLIVSPCHRMLLTGWRSETLFGEPDVLVTAKQLCILDHIFVREGGEVEYFHLLFDRHEIIFAEGAPTESFLPGTAVVSAMEREVRDEVLALFPELARGDAPGVACRALSDGEARLLLG